MLNVNKCKNTKPKPKTTLIFKNCSCVCISLCTTVVHNTAQNRTVLIIFPLILQTTAIPSLLAPVKSTMVYLSGAGLPKVGLEKGRQIDIAAAVVIHLVTFSTYRCYINNCIYLSVYPPDNHSSDDVYWRKGAGVECYEFTIILNHGVLNIVEMNSFTSSASCCGVFSG